MSGGNREADRRIEYWTLAGIVAAHLCIAAPLAIILNIWIDEAYSLAASTGDLPFVLRQSRDVEMQPPLYFVLLWAWRLIDPSIAWARMLSVVIAAFALVATHFAARRWLKGISPAWVVAPLALNRYTIYASSEIRPYSLMLLWTALLLIFLYDGFFVDRPRRSARVLYAGIALDALSTYYYLGFILGAGMVALLAVRRWRPLRDYVIWMTGVGILFLPLFLHTSGHIESSSLGASKLPGLFYSFVFVLVRAVSFPFSLLSFSSELRIAVVMIIALACLGIAWSQRARISPEMLALWVITAVVAVFYVFVTRFVMGDEVRPRHMLVALPPVIFSFVSVATLVPRYQQFALTVWVVAALGFSTVASVDAFKPLAKGGDFKRVAKYLQANEKPGQSIAIVVANAEVPLSYYYHGVNKLLPVPEKDVLDVFEPIRWQLQSAEQVRAKLDPAVSKDGEIWVVTDFVPGDKGVAVGIDLQFHFLEEALASGYDLVSRQDFYAACIRLYKKRADAGAPQTVGASLSNSQSRG